MGLFFKKEICCICNNKEGKKKIIDGFICKDCLQLCSIRFQVKINKNTTKEEILTEIKDNENNKQLINEFKTTKKIGKYIEIDEEKKLWFALDKCFGKKLTPKIYSFDDILEYELLENGESITKGGLGRAVVGGALLGGIGAIVGGVTGGKKTKSIVNSLGVKITINDINNPNIYISLITSPTKSSSIIYKSAYSQAQEILSVLSIITKNNKQNVEDNGTVSVADELIKLKSLLDEGILTEDEFINEKNKILNK